MKELYLIRHAKSSWKDSSLDDFDRPLNKRGDKDALLMGTMLHNNKTTPDAIISSPALRAKTTAKIIADAIHFHKPVHYDKTLYEADLDTLLQTIKALDDKDDTVFLIAHNPGLNMLAEDLVDLRENLPTCGIVRIQFSCSRWTKIDAGDAALISFDYPKKYHA